MFLCILTFSVYRFSVLSNLLTFEKKIPCILTARFFFCQVVARYGTRYHVSKVLGGVVLRSIADLRGQMSSTSCHYIYICIYIYIYIYIYINIYIYIYLISKFI